MYSFIWDVVMDWGLVDTTTLQLRKDAHFSHPSVYLVAVIVNSLLRGLKIFSHLHHIHPFCVDFSEIVRRFIWVVFRFEYEWTKQSYYDVERGVVMTDFRITTLPPPSQQAQKEQVHDV